jgi:hypothetical protein
MAASATPRKVIEPVRKALISGAAADLEARDPQFIRAQLYALAHSLITAWPVVGTVGRKWGIITASPHVAEAALASGACGLVYPRGDLEFEERPASRRQGVSKRRTA